MSEVKKLRKTVATQMDPDSEGELEDINTQECDGRTADGAKDPTC